MAYSPAVKLIDEAGAAYGVKHVSNKIRVSAMPYTYDIAEGNISDHDPVGLIGYSPTMTTAQSDIWSAAGAYVWPAAAQQMELHSSENSQDIATVIKSGTSTGGSTTTLIDTGKDFTAATAVAAGDCVILDGTDEFGFVTSLTSTNQLNIAAGFSEGGSASEQAYRVVDYSSTTGAHVVLLKYLDAAFAEKRELIIANGTTDTNTAGSDIYRIQEVHVVAAGSGNAPVGALSIRNTAGTVTYAFITAAYTQARQLIWTVPAGKTLYVTSLRMGWADSANQINYARLWLRCNRIHGSDFSTGRIFNPFIEVMCANNTINAEMTFPLVLSAGTDIIAGGIATSAGTATAALRGWIE